MFRRFPGVTFERLEAPKMTKKNILIAAVVIGAISLVFLIAGVVFFAYGSKKTESHSSSTSSCGYSDEAKRIGLDGLLRKVQDTYYQEFPDQIYSRKGIKAKDVRKLYKVFDFSPEKIKQTTDIAKKLYQEMSSIKFDVQKLKQREKKAFSQMKFFLKYGLSSNGYDSNYYTGDWMMGPDQFCYKPICWISYEVEGNFQYLKPSTVEEMELVKSKLVDLNNTFARYIENLKLGVNAGMVPPEESCKAGLYGLGAMYPQVFRKGEQGIFEESMVYQILSKRFLSKMQDDIQQLMLWRQKYGKPVNESLREFVLQYLGRPIDRLFKYLKVEYKTHCVPSSVSSGFATLPLPYVYVNGTKDVSRPTTGKLPTGEKLNGSKAYEYIMTFFTTNDMTPNEVNTIGLDALHKLYPQVLEIARQVTGQNNNTLAKQAFIQRLNQSDMYYINNPIPKNESGKEARDKCVSMETAKVHCPTRWKAMVKWFSDARQVMTKLDGKIVSMFYFTGNKRTTPSCPAELQPDFNPESSAQSYMRSDAICSMSASYNIPFFMTRPGPTYEEWSVNAHEVMPGHHLQDQGNIENFMDSCGGNIGWIQSITIDSFTAFVEGWGLYAENPLISNGTNIYKDEPFYKYGMLKWQIWRALRLIVDTGLHYRKMTRAEAIKMFEKYTWATGDHVTKEITRYQSVPGQAVSYMIGRRQLMKIRAYAEKELGSKFDLKDFHYQVLSQGTAPLSYFEEHIKTYVSCVKNPTDDCKLLLNPKPKTTAKKHTTMGDRKNIINTVTRKRGKPPIRRYL